MRGLFGWCQNDKKNEFAPQGFVVIGRTCSFALVRRKLTIRSGCELLTDAYWEADPHPGTPEMR